MRLGMAVVALLAVAACGGGDESDSPSTSASTLTAKANVVAVNPGVLLDRAVDCDEMPGEYAELATGADVELRDADGRVAAVAELEPIANINEAGKLCAWTAEFEAVSEGGRSYVASIGKWESPEVTESDLPERDLSINTG